MERPGFSLKGGQAPRKSLTNTKTFIMAVKGDFLAVAWSFRRRYYSRSVKRSRKIVKGAKREVAMWPGNGGLIYVRGCTRAHPKLYDFVHFTLKAFSRLMDDFSLTNSNCELSAREIPGDESGSSRASRLPPFDLLSARGAFRRAHKLSSSIKTLLPA